jgi:hypothetical protein
LRSIGGFCCASCGLPSCARNLKSMFKRRTAAGHY